MNVGTLMLSVALCLMFFIVYLIGRIELRHHFRKEE
jgi:hypothetical protein